MRQSRIEHTNIIGRNILIKPIVIAILEAAGATICVLAGLLIVHFIRPDLVSVPVALMLSAIASATAPAATIMVIKQYKANLHCHSILSDGKKTPEELKELYGVP